MNVWSLPGSISKPTVRSRLVLPIPGRKRECPKWVDRRRSPRASQLGGNRPVVVAARAAERRPMRLAPAHAALLEIGRRFRKTLDADGAETGQFASPPDVRSSSIVPAKSRHPANSWWNIGDPRTSLIRKDANTEDRSIGSSARFGRKHVELNGRAALARRHVLNVLGLDLIEREMHLALQLGEIDLL